MPLVWAGLATSSCGVLEGGGSAALSEATRAAKLKAPSFQEGFAKITVVRVKKKEAEAAE